MFAAATDSTPLHKPRRMHYGDAIRILGTVAVVIGHIADMRLFDAKVLDRDWWVCNAWDALTRWAVPCYIMLSGRYCWIPPRPKNLSISTASALARLGVPLIFWTAVFMWFGVEYTGWINRDGKPSWAEAFRLLVARKALHAPALHVPDRRALFLHTDVSCLAETFTPEHAVGGGHRRPDPRRRR